MGILQNLSFKFGYKEPDEDERYCSLDGKKCDDAYAGGHYWTDDDTDHEYFCPGVEAE